MEKKLQEKISDRQRGMVLLASLILVVTIVALTGHVLFFTITEARAVAERTEGHTAFYLAEAGLEAAKWEIGEAQDPDTDGVGNKTASTVNGSYTVTATDLGGGTYRLTSTGSSGANSVTLELVVKKISHTKFPRGAMSVVGNISDLDVAIETDSDLILAGGDSPALSFSDIGLYNRISQEFANAVDGGQLPAANITGSPPTSFTAGSGNTVELPIAHQPSYDDSLKDLTALYTNLVAKVNLMRPSATVVGPVFDPSYGTAESPVTIYAPNPNTVTAQSISGFGTLIVGDVLALSTGASLNWIGDIFVIGDATKDAELKVSNGATLSVTGNLAILGEGAIDTEFEVTSGGQATINGSLFFGTDWTNSAGPETELEINNGGGLTVNGLLTMVGPEIEIEFIELTSNPNNTISITGMLEIAVPAQAGVETSLELELQGAVEIRKDDQAIHNGAEALNGLGVDYGVTEVQQLIRDNYLSTDSWRRISA